MKFRVTLSVIALAFLVASTSQAKASDDCTIKIANGRLSVTSALIDKGYTVVEESGNSKYTLNSKYEVVQEPKPYIYPGQCTYEKGYDVVSITDNDSAEVIDSVDSIEYWSGWTCVTKSPIQSRRDTKKNHTEAVIKAIKRLKKCRPSA